MSDAEVAGQLAAVRHEQIQPHAQTRPLLDRLADDREALQNEQAKRRKARTDEIEKRRENARYRELEQALDRDPDGPDSAKNRRELIALGNQIDRGGTGQTGARPPETPAPAPPSSSYPPPVGEQQQLLEEPVPYDAKPPEAGGEEPPATNITNARLDAERAKRGLPPMETTLRRGWGKAVDIAREKLAANPQVTDELIAELQAQPRALEDWEDVLLAQRFMDLQSQHAAAAGDIVKARETGDDSSVTAARSRKAVLDDQLQALDTAMKQGGTRTAQGLAARKAMLREDWSLAAMELRARADMPDGLTEDEINARIDRRRQHAELEKIKAEQDRNEAAALESEVKSVFDEILNGRQRSRPRSASPSSMPPKKSSRRWKTRAARRPNESAPARLGAWRACLIPPCWLTWASWVRQRSPASAWTWPSGAWNIWTNGKRRWFPSSATASNRTSQSFRTVQKTA